MATDDSRFPASPAVALSANASREASLESAAVSWRALLSTYLPALVLALGAGIALPAVPALAKSFDVTFGVASGVVTAYLVGNVAGTLPTGWLIDRFGLRAVMIAGPLLTSATALLVWRATSFDELLVLRFLGGFAAQMWVMGRLAAISQGASTAQRGRQVSWMFGMDNTGMLAGPLLGGYLAARWGAGAPFLAFSAIALLALVPTLIFATPRMAAKRGAAGNSADPRATTFREIVLPRLAFFGLTLLAGLTRGPVAAGLLLLYAAFEYDLGPEQIGYLATGAATISWPIGFIAGWMMDRFGRKRTIIPGFTGVAISMLALASSAFLDLSYSWFVALFFVAVAFQALTGGSIQTVGTDVAPPQARGQFLALWRFTGQGGSALSPLVFSQIVSALNYGSAFLFVGVTAVCIVLLAIFRVPETGARR